MSTNENTRKAHFTQSSALLGFPKDSSGRFPPSPCASGAFVLNTSENRQRYKPSTMIKPFRDMRAYVQQHKDTIGAVPAWKSYARKNGWWPADNEVEASDTDSATSSSSTLSSDSSDSSDSSNSNDLSAGVPEQDEPAPVVSTGIQLLALTNLSAIIEVPDIRMSMVFEDAGPARKRLRLTCLPQNQ